MTMQSNVLFGALLAVSAVAFAAPAEEAVKPQSAQSQQSVQSEQGMRVYVDPATGELVSQPTTEEGKRAAAADAKSQAFRQDDEGLVVEHHADGSMSMDLQGRFQQATVAEVQADGSIRTYCSDADHMKLGHHSHDETAQPVSVAPASDLR